MEREQTLALIKASEHLALKFVEEFSPSDLRPWTRGLSHLPSRAPTQVRLEECIGAFRDLVAFAHGHGLSFGAGPRTAEAMLITRDYLLRAEAVGRCVGRQDGLVRMMRDIYRAWPGRWFADAKALLVNLTRQLDIPSSDDFFACIHMDESSPWTGRYLQAVTDVSSGWPDGARVGAEIGAFLEDPAVAAAGDTCLFRMRIARHCSRLQEFRSRSLHTLEGSDRPAIEDLFRDLLDRSLHFQDQSPAAVGQALHLLAPEFFPWWDRWTEHSTADFGSKGDPEWDARPDVATQYVRYCWRVKRFITHVVEGAAGSLPQPILVMHARYQHSLTEQRRARQ